MNPSANTPSSAARPDAALDALCRELAALLHSHGWMLATAESCTGGLVAAACTDVAGSSQWFERGYVCYANASKFEMLGVDSGMIANHGAVSEPVVRAMAQGALAHSRAQVSVAVSGIAGPDGGTDDKPVGTVWFAWETPGVLRSEKQRFTGDRGAVRQAAVQHALKTLLEIVQSAPAAHR